MKRKLCSGWMTLTALRLWVRAALVKKPLHGRAIQRCSMEKCGRWFNLRGSVPVTAKEWDRRLRSQAGNSPPCSRR